MDLNVRTRSEGDWSIIEVEGEVDMFTSPKLREAIVRTVDTGSYRILVDLEGVTFMDSTGLGTLVGGLKRVKEHDGILALVCSSRSVMRVLTITGLNNVFSISSSVEEALAG